MVMIRPMIGSPISRPSARTIALATTARLTRPSVRACAPSAISAGLSSARPARVRICAAISLPTKPMIPAAASGHR